MKALIKRCLLEDIFLIHVHRTTSLSISANFYHLSFRFTHMARIRAHLTKYSSHIFKFRFLFHIAR